MQSKEAPRKAANNKEKCHGQRGSAGGTRNTCARETSGTQPTDTYRQYHWHRNNTGNKPPPQPYSNRGPGPSPCYSGGLERKQEHQADSRVEQRHACRPEYSVGPSHVCKTDGSVKTMHGNEPDNGMGPRHRTGRPPGSAPWPENIPDGRHPVWAVPGKDWLVLLPNTMEPLELGSPEEAEEPMEVDPPRPDQTWDYPGMSSLSAIRAHHQRHRSARRAPYSLLRPHPKH